MLFAVNETDIVISVKNTDRISLEITSSSLWSMLFAAGEPLSVIISRKLRAVLVGEPLEKDRESWRKIYAGSV